MMSNARRYANATEKQKFEQMRTIPYFNTTMKKYILIQFPIKIHILPTSGTAISETDIFHDM